MQATKTSAIKRTIALVLFFLPPLEPPLDPPREDLEAPVDPLLELLEESLRELLRPDDGLEPLLEAEALLAAVPLEEDDLDEPPDLLAGLSS